MKMAVDDSLSENQREQKEMMMERTTTGRNRSHWMRHFHHLTNARHVRDGPINCWNGGLQNTRIRTTVQTERRSDWKERSAIETAENEGEQAAVAAVC